MEVDKAGKLKPRQVEEGIASMPLDKFFDFLSCMEKDAVWWSFNMNDFVHKRTRRLHIGTEKEYAVFTGIISKPDAKRTIYLRFANLEEDFSA